RLITGSPWPLLAAPSSGVALYRQHPTKVSTTSNSKNDGSATEALWTAFAVRWIFTAKTRL
ncbi:hypothetical protein, partial [Methylopila jiangsuensis]|uniref:hypothetical protein n=1 Tax=Methylopila jiangsuensis TaxID=586230 RepID=UPI00286B88C3